ncbi:phosphoglucosamine mutase [Candidatus Micrarchaeota archaeon]|nr:phosphoglucosamine mutase [Candidatus Micrarchaeota archaeon]
MAKYFGTNGVRGRFDELTPELTLRLSQAIGTYFKGGKIVVARDCRLTGDVLRSAVVSGLASVGCEVIDLGMASSPTAEYMVKRLAADGCIIISASHNPPEWNALKVVDGRGIALSRERGEEIERLMEKPGLAGWDKVGKIRTYETGTVEHIEAVKKLAQVERIAKRKPKIVIDCGNGAASFIAPRLLKELGCEITSLNSHPDGRFPGRPSEPTEANVKELIALVKSSGADAGIAWDGDGDRVIFVDEKGSYVIGDRVYALSIIWKADGKKLKGDVVTTVATSKAVEDVAAKYGARIRYTAIGAPYLCEEMARMVGILDSSGRGAVRSMAKKSAAMGGEEVGGVIWPELSMAKDGFMTAAKLAEALCEKPLSRWLEEVPRYSNVKLKIEADEKNKKEIVERVLAHAKNKKLDCVTVDGVRINLKDAWVICRPSGTEPYVRIFAEARNAGEAKRLAEEYEKIAKGT